MAALKELKRHTSGPSIREGVQRKEKDPREHIHINQVHDNTLTLLEEYKKLF